MSEHCCATRLCRELGRVLNDSQFADVYAGTSKCPRSQFRVSKTHYFLIFDKELFQSCFKLKVYEVVKFFDSKVSDLFQVYIVRWLAAIDRIK